jgi:hypothetical protein
MKTTHKQNLLAAALVGALGLTTSVAWATADLLPSRNDTAPKVASTL